jgi:pimeloyl-ACP methyl ester carboxylesterase
LADSWVSLDGGSIYVETIGEGEDALVMPVAWGMSHDFHEALIAELDLGLRLNFFDPEGAGISAVPPMGWSPARIIDEAEAVRQSLGLDAITLLGHQSGAFLSLAYALDHPARVKGLILVSPFASYARAAKLGAPRLEAAPHWKAFQQRVSDIRRAKLTRQDRFRAIFKEQRAVDLYAYGPHYFQMADAADEAIFNPEMHDDVETDLLDELHTIESPALVIVGIGDPICPVEEARLIAAELPFVRLIELEECGHFPYVEQPRLFTQAVERFMEDIAVERPVDSARRQPSGRATG